MYDREGSFSSRELPRPQATFFLDFLTHFVCSFLRTLDESNWFSFRLEWASGDSTRIVQQEPAVWARLRDHLESTFHAVLQGAQNGQVP